MSLLSIMQSASEQINLSAPTTVVSNTDPTVVQMLRLANAEGKDLARRYDWQILVKEATFTTVAAETQATVTTLATDFLRIVDNSMWNRTQSMPVRGPLSPQQWQTKKASAAQAGFGNWFRVRGGLILFYPTPPAGETVYFEYVSTNWCESSGGTGQSAWAADTDVALIDEDIITLGIVWRYLQQKGLDYAEPFRTYELALQNIFAPDGGNDLVDLTGDHVILGSNIPEGSWSL